MWRSFTLRRRAVYEFFGGDVMLTRSEEVDKLWQRVGDIIEELEEIRAVLAVLHVAVSEDEAEKLISEGDKG